MKHHINLIVAGCSLALITGCASTKQFVHFPDQTKEIENPSMGRIYVARPAFVGAAVSMKVSDGDQLIGKTGPKGYLCWERSPGETTIKGKAENTSELTLTVEQGKSYYIQQHLKMGILIARNKLSLLDEETGKMTVSKCKPPKE